MLDAYRCHYNITHYATYSNQAQVCKPFLLIVVIILVNALNDICIVCDIQVKVIPLKHADPPRMMLIGCLQF